MPRRPDGSVVPVLHGDKAVAAIEKLEGRKLTPKEVRTVHLEGFVPDVYLDSKGIPTYGVGQTGKWMKKSFGESFQHHEDLTRGMIPSYDKLPEYLQSELTQATYRGDLGMSPTARKLFNAGKYKEAAKEFLDHAEYKDPKTPAQIKRRIESVSRAMLRYAQEP